MRCLAFHSMPCVPPSLSLCFRPHAFALTRLFFRIVGRAAGCAVAISCGKESGRDISPSRCVNGWQWLLRAFKGALDRCDGKESRTSGFLTVLGCGDARAAPEAWGRLKMRGETRSNVESNGRSVQTKQVRGIGVAKGWDKQAGKGTGQAGAAGWRGGRGTASGARRASGALQTRGALRAGEARQTRGALRAR